jgi:hypothetical protein
MTSHKRGHPNARIAQPSSFPTDSSASPVPLRVSDKPLCFPRSWLRESGKFHQNGCQVHSFRLHCMRTLITEAASVNFATLASHGQLCVLATSAGHSEQSQEQLGKPGAIKKGRNDDAEMAVPAFSWKADSRFNSSAARNAVALVGSSARGR